MPKASSGKSLVLVVGAGASKEANLPIGGELKQQIADALDIRYDHRRISGDHLIDGAFKIIAHSNDSYRGDINPFLQASWRIRDAMPQAISIDNFIDAHRSDGKIAVAGKLAIARCILAAESNSPLKIDRGNIYNKIDFKALEKTWFNAFFQLLTENCQQSDIPERFAKVAIICFNYDRCIEHYLHSALQNYYGMTTEEASAAMTLIEIHHPYGTVGKLPWQNRGNGIDFGATPQSSQLVDLTGEIRTFTEGTDTKTSDISAIRTALAKAKRIAFLGFAFHRLNIELLFPTLKHGAVVRDCPVYATALGISNGDIQVISEEISSLGSIVRGRVQLGNSLTCAKLFSEFWRSLAIR